MEISIKGEPKEIAALLFEIAERQKKDTSQTVLEELAKSFQKGTKATSEAFRAYVHIPQ